MEPIPETPDDDTVHHRALRASLPFAIVEKLSLTCGYERSAKFSSRKLLANRYLLGIPAAEISADAFTDICRQLDLPNERQSELVPFLSEANIVFLGCEDNESDIVLKIYLELYDRRRAELLADPNITVPLLTHIGIKWCSGRNDIGQVAKYFWYPKLSPLAVVERMEAIYRGGLSTSRACTRQIVERAFARSSRCIYLEVEEPNTPRRSFDMNIYGANIRIDQVADLLHQAAISYGLSTTEYERLAALISNCRAGHVSGGIDRHGEDFFTIYYETDDAV